MALESPPEATASAAAGPVIVAGMHRSGTSLTASFLEALGIDMGRDLVPADEHNRRGYFEDTGFLGFQRSLLRESCPTDDGGWPDWGWTEHEVLHRDRFATRREAAEHLITSRRGRALWGWKDPRTSLLLDFWDELLPEARYVFVYRAPWDVADSILRLKHPALDGRPDFGLRVWSAYNRAILDFRRRHPERCLLTSLDALVARPQSVVRLLRSKLSLDLPEPSPALGDDLLGVFAPELLVQLPLDDPFVRAARLAAPFAEAVLAELEANADFPMGPFSADPTPPRGRGAEHPARPAPQPASGPPEPRGRHREGVDVTVVIPCHDDGSYLLEAVASVECVPAPVYEIVVVDDGSRDPGTLRTLTYLEKLGYLVVHQENRGLAAARNTGIELAHGRFVLPLDADNRVRPEYLTRAIEVLEAAPEVGVVYADAQFFGERHGRRVMGSFDVQKLMGSSYIDACAMFRRRAWEDVGGYDTTLPVMALEDWDFWLAIAEHGWRFHYIPEVLFDYRVRRGSLVSLVEVPENRRDLIRHIVSRHPGLYATGFPEVIAGKEFALAQVVKQAEALETEALSQALRSRGLEIELERTRSELDQARRSFALVETSRTWRIRKRLLPLTSRFQRKV
jgi:hypothetical protein